MWMNKSISITVSVVWINYFCCYCVNDPNKLTDIYYLTNTEILSWER